MHQNGKKAVEGKLRACRGIKRNFAKYFFSRPGIEQNEVSAPQHFPTRLQAGKNASIRRKVGLPATFAIDNFMRGNAPLGGDAPNLHAQVAVGKYHLIGAGAELGVRGVRSLDLKQRCEGL